MLSYFFSVFIKLRFRRKMSVLRSSRSRKPDSGRQRSHSQATQLNRTLVMTPRKILAALAVAALTFASFASAAVQPFTPDFKAPEDNSQDFAAFMQKARSED